MWKWIKKLFRPWNLDKVAPDINAIKPNTVIITKKSKDLTGLTKGDIKRLKGQGKI